MSTVPPPHRPVVDSRCHPVPLRGPADGAGALLDVPEGDGSRPAALRVVSTRPRHGVAVVRVAGEIDLVDAARLDAVLRTAVVDAAATGRLAPRERPRVVCDLDGVGFLGAAGLGVLASAVAVAHAHDVELVCFTVRRSVRQVIRLTALDRALSLIPTELEVPPTGAEGESAAWST